MGTGGGQGGAIPVTPEEVAAGGGVKFTSDRLGIIRDPRTGQVVGQSMSPDKPYTEAQTFASQNLPDWFRSDIYDAAVESLNAGENLKSYTIEGRGTQGTLRIVFDNGRVVNTGFRDSDDVRAHADQMLALSKAYQPRLQAPPAAPPPAAPPPAAPPPAAPPPAAPPPATPSVPASPSSSANSPTRASRRWAPSPA